MADNAELRLSRRAFAKMILHAAKYPHCAVNGLLLAKQSKDPKDLLMVDCVPLFHQVQGLSPMAEVALAQVELVASGSQLHIAGYYHANENLGDCGVDVFSQRLADTVAAHCPGPVALVTLDNRRLGLVMESPAVIAQLKVDGKWRTKDGVVLEEGTLEATSAMLQKRLQEQLMDFDNHLDDITKDFLNQDVNMEIDECFD